MFNRLMKYLIRALPIAYMLIIWYQSAHFNPETVTTLPLAALVSLGVLLELAHFFQFGILYLLLIVAALTFGQLTKRKVGLAVIISLGYALSDEVHQYFVPFRSFTISDLVKDAAGVFLAWLFIRKAYRSETSPLGGYLRKCSKLFH